MNEPITERTPAAAPRGWVLVVLVGLFGCGQPLAPPASSAPQAPMDSVPGRRTAPPVGAWEAVVLEGGALVLRPRSQGSAPPSDAAVDVPVDVPVDVGVDTRVAFSKDGGVLYYARRGALDETDLWRVRIPDGAPERLTEGVGSADRPTLSPDGNTLAYVSGRSGIASWWLLPLDGAPGAASGLASGLESARQLTNVGLEAAPHRPGVAPEGFVPVPDGSAYAWTASGLEWVTAGRHYRVVP